MKKNISRLISRHFFSYLIVLSVCFYSIYKFKNIPSSVTIIFLLFTVVFTLENSYQQYLEDKAAGKKHQTFNQFINNVDWPIVIAALIICALIYILILFISGTIKL